MTMMVCVLLAIAATALVLAASLPAKGPLWPAAICAIALVGLFRNFRSGIQGTAKVHAYQVAVTLTLMAGAVYFANDLGVRKYGAPGLYLLGIAWFACLRGRQESLRTNVGFIVAVGIITCAWSSDAVVQAMYEWRNAGGITARYNECAAALGQLTLSGAWIVSIVVTVCFGAFARTRSSSNGTVLARAASNVWIVAGSITVGIILGVTEWRDWQVQTVCF